MAEINKNKIAQRAKHHEFMLNILQSTFDSLYGSQGPSKVTECAMATTRAYLDVIRADWPLMTPTFSQESREWRVRAEEEVWKSRVDTATWDEEEEVLRRRVDTATWDEGGQQSS